MEDPVRTEYLHDCGATFRKYNELGRDQSLAWVIEA